MLVNTASKLHGGIDGVTKNINWLQHSKFFHNVSRPKVFSEKKSKTTQQLSGSSGVTDKNN